MGLERANVVHGRIETVLSQLKPDTVTARALGNVEKISAWIWSCSTWNNLLLFKSRGWQEEWNEAKTSRFGKKLTVTHSHDYSSPEKTRLLITLNRPKMNNLFC